MPPQGAGHAPAGSGTCPRKRRGRLRKERDRAKLQNTNCGGVPYGAKYYPLLSWEGKTRLSSVG